ncbi:hypothetical protein KKG22_04725 [Patescibacteria group bacterium]|nr:hypothetical protein [Patescibacteria group bacterium]MBU1721640.1 hypothetical protein [Patescibacteria group bacterium]MBU1901698.1 hypothetical protein [Patescibacteria group bacterium]
MKKIFILFALLFIFSGCSLFSSKDESSSMDNTKGEKIEVSVKETDSGKLISNGKDFFLKTSKEFADIEVNESTLTHEEALLPIYNFDRVDGVKNFANDPVYVSFMIPEEHKDKDLTVVQVLDLDGEIIFRQVASSLSADRNMIGAELKHFSNYSISQERYGTVKIPEEVKAELMRISQNPPEGAVEFSGKVTYVAKAGRADWEMFTVHKGCKAKTQGKWEVTSVEVKTEDYNSICTYDPETDKQTCEKRSNIMDSWKIAFQWGFDIDPAGNCQVYDGEIEIEDLSENKTLGHFTARPVNTRGNFRLMVDHSVQDVDPNFIGNIEGNIYGSGELKYDFAWRENVFPLAEIQNLSKDGIIEGLYLEGKSEYDGDKTTLTFDILGVPKVDERIFATPLYFKDPFTLKKMPALNKYSDFLNDCPNFGLDGGKMASVGPFNSYAPIVKICQEMTFSMLLQQMRWEKGGEHSAKVFEFNMEEDDNTWKEFDHKIAGIPAARVKMKLTQKTNPSPEEVREDLQVTEEEIPEVVTAASTSGGGMVSSCGNGILERKLHEECDDGNKENGDGCNALCEKEEEELPYDEDGDGVKDIWVEEL